MKKVENHKLALFLLTLPTAQSGSGSRVGRVSPEPRHVQLSTETRVTMDNANGFLASIKHNYDYVFTDLRDPRYRVQVSRWFL